MRCSFCNVNIEGDSTSCPLCGGKAEGTAGEALFARVDKVRSWRKISFWGVYLIAFFAFSALLIAINYAYDPALPWSFTAIIALFIVFVAARYILYSNSHPGSKLFGAMLLLTALIMSVQRLTPNTNWAYTYAIPVFLMLGGILMGALSANAKSAGAYAMYMMAVSIFGMMPIFFHLAFKEEILLPSIICASSCGTVIIMGLTANFNAIKSELARRFHV